MSNIIFLSDGRENDRSGSRPNRPDNPGTSRPVKLSPAEEEVLELVAEGLTNAAIANALGKRPATVKAQVASILRKLGVRNRTAAVAWWVGRGRRRR